MNHFGRDGAVSCGEQRASPTRGRILRASSGNMDTIPKLPIRFRGIAERVSGHWLLVVYCITKLQLYYITLAPPVYVFNLRVGLGWVCLVAYCIRNRLKIEPVVMMSGFLLTTIMYYVKFRHASEYPITHLLYPNYLDLWIFLSIVLSLDRPRSISLFEAIRSIFVISALPGLVIYALIFIGVELPYFMVNISERGFIYRNYYGLAIMTDYAFTSVGPFTIGRLCGLCEEPGMLGTWLGFFLVGEMLTLKRLGTIGKLLIIEGVATLSLAFLVIGIGVLLYLLINSKFRGKIEVLGATALGMAFLTIFSSTDLMEYVNTNYLGRLGFSMKERAFVDESRAGFQERYMEYGRTATLDDLWLGRGYGSNSRGDFGGEFSTIHAVAFELGLAGVALVILLLIYYYIMVPFLRKRYAIAFLGCFCVASFYQRGDFACVYNTLVIGLISGACEIGEPGGKPPRLRRRI